MPHKGRNITFKSNTSILVERSRTEERLGSHGTFRKLYPICESEEDKQMCKDHKDNHKDQGTGEELRQHAE